MTNYTIFEELRKDHEKQRSLFKKLLETTGSSLLRRETFQELRDNLKNHAKFEEQHFYAPLMGEDITADASRHATHEHYIIDAKIEELEKIDFSSPQWLIKLKELKDYVDHHLNEEEHEIFQLAGRALNEKQKINLGKKYHREMHI